MMEYGRSKRRSAFHEDRRECGTYSAASSAAMKLVAQENVEAMLYGVRWKP
jgi:hypothetical protein